MNHRKVVSGFALLNVLLGVGLLTGIIFLIMYAMTNFHSEEKSRAIGEELAPIADTLLANDSISAVTVDTTYNPSLCASNGIFSTVPAGYMQSLKTSGFDLCGSTVKVCMGECKP